MPVFHMIYRGLNYANLLGVFRIAITMTFCTFGAITPTGAAALAGAVAPCRTADTFYATLFGLYDVDYCGTDDNHQYACQDEIRHSHTPFSKWFSSIYILR